jgi:hypothetical protein
VLVEEEVNVTLKESQSYIVLSFSILGVSVFRAVGRLKVKLFKFLNNVFSRRVFKMVRSDV